MEGPPLGPGGEYITWPNQVAPRGRKASSTRKIKPQTSDLLVFQKKLNFAQAKDCFFRFFLRSCISGTFCRFTTCNLSRLRI